MTAHPGARMVGESYKDHSARVFGMLLAAEKDLAWVPEVDHRGLVDAIEAGLVDKLLHDSVEYSPDTREWAESIAARIIRHQRKGVRPPV